jgi:hypothetical protein
MKTIGGSFFEAVPTDADVTLRRWVLHDWNDSDALAILKAVRQSMKPEARLILVEFVLPKEATYSFGKWTDLQMLMVFGGGERTKQEYDALLQAAGFELEEVIPTSSPVNLIVAKPI